MAFSSCFCLSPIPLKIDRSGQAIRSRRITAKQQKFILSVKGSSTELFGEQLAREGSELHSGWSFLKGSRIIVHPKLTNFIVNQKASGLTRSQLASSAFTLGIVAVLPFYTLMVVAPKVELTRKSMKSSMPYVLLGLLYAFVLFLSWTPDTLRLLFPNKYWLPELPGIAKMFSSEMTIASAWIHMLAVDLFAARQVFRDGLRNEVETRHSVSLCMLACPIGIVTHVMTKALARSAGSAGH